MELVEGMKSAYALRKKKEELEAQVEKLKAEIDAIEDQLQTQNSQILAILKELKKDEVLEEGLYANLFSKEAIGYTSDKDVIAWLKANGYSSFVKSKVTESLDKNPLKKAIKADPKLAEALAGMTVRSTTEWVVVTDEENHAKMLEHIREGKESKQG